MTSLYLNRTIRTLTEVLRERVNTKDLFFVVEAWGKKGEDKKPLTVEMNPTMDRDDLVRELYEGQFTDVVCVLRGAVGEPLEDCTDDLCRLVGDYTANHEEWRVWGCEEYENDFLDAHWPNWKQEQRRVW